MTIFVYPRLPSAAILDFVEPQNSTIRSANPEKPSLEPWSGSDAPFSRYSPSNYTVIVKLGFGVTQGHRKRHRSIQHYIRLYIRFPYSKYASIYYRFRACVCVCVCVCGFLPNSNNDLLIYWYSRMLVENRYSLVFAPRWGWSRQIYATTLGDAKLEFRWYVQPFWYNTRVWRTDRRTDGIAVAYTRYSICCRAKKSQKVVHFQTVHTDFVHIAIKLSRFPVLTLTLNTHLWSQKTPREILNFYS